MKTILKFTEFVNESINEKFTFADAVDTAGEDVKKNEKGIASALKTLKAKSGSDISIMTDTTEDDGLFDAIKDMKLYKGGIPAEYGSRVSSVLDVRQKEGNANFREASGGIGLISSRFMVEGPMWDRSSFMVAGRRSYGDLFLALSSDSTLNSNKLYFYDLNMKFNTWVGQKDRIFLSSYIGRDAFKFGGRFASSWGNETINLRWLHLFSDRTVANLSYNYNDYD